MNNVWRPPTIGSIVGGEWDAENINFSYHSIQVEVGCVGVCLVVYGVWERTNLDDGRKRAHSNRTECIDFLWFRIAFKSPACVFALDLSVYHLNRCAICGQPRSR